MAEAIKRNEVLIDEREAGKWIQDGMTVILGGFIISSHPMAIVRRKGNRRRKLGVQDAHQREL